MVDEQRQTDGENWNERAAGDAGDWQTPTSNPNDLIEESARQPGEGRRSWGTGAGHETTGGGMTGGSDTGIGMTSGGIWNEGDDDGAR